MWWWWTGCVAFIPADYDPEFSLDVPLPAPNAECDRVETDGAFEIEHAWEAETLQCVARTTWRGDLLDLDGVRAAVAAMASEYGREADQVREVRVQQLDYEIVKASIGTSGGTTGLTLPAVVQSRVDFVPDVLPDTSLALVVASTDTTDWLAVGVSRDTDAGPSRNRAHYEPGANELLDALTDLYAAGEPFEGEVVTEIRMSDADLAAMMVYEDLVLDLDVRVALGATFWIRIP